MDERGQVTPLVALVVLAIGGLLFGVGRFGGIAAQAAQAQAAADAAALAAAAEGSEAAGAMAEANGGVVATVEQLGTDVQVRVRVGETWAVARARRIGGGDAGVRGWVGQSSAGGVGARLAPALRVALERAAALLDQPVPIAEGGGRTIAVPRPFAARLAFVAPSVGLCRLPSQTDPVRFTACPDSRR